jgi:hypothetical protein
MRVSRAITMMVSALVALGAPRASAAQTSPPLEVYAGYSYLADPDNSVLQATAGNSGLKAGWIVGAAVPLSGWLAAVAEAGGNDKSLPTIDGELHLSVLTFMAGARASARIGRITEFGQVLVGAVRGSGSAFGLTVSNTGFGIQPGGGLDWPVDHRLAARLELDFRTISGTDEGRDRAHQFRAIAAIVYRFGR